MSLKEFTLPDPGEGLVEAEIVSWLVAVGDTVEVNQMVLEVETAKSLVELPIPWDGVVKELLVSEGDTVEVGAPIIVIDTAGEADDPAAGADQASAGAESLASSDAAAQTVVAAPAASGQATADSGAVAVAVAEPDEGDAADEQPKTLVGYGPQATSTRRRARKGGGVLAAPATRGFAKQVGVDVEDVPPGEDGIVRVEHIEAYRGRHSKGTLFPPTPPVPGAPAVAGVGGVSGVDGAAPRAPRPLAAAPAGVPAASPDAERIPIKGVRKVTAQTMVASAFTAPHVTEFLEVDMTETMRFVEQQQREREFRDIKVTPLLIVAKACLIALKREPMMNALWDEQEQEIEMRPQVNLGIAAATSRGLLVPNIKDAGRFGLVELAQEIGKIVEIARNGKPSPAVLNGGTFSISNIGVFGVDAGTPIIKPGESGILAIGTVRSKPWVVTNDAGEEEIAIRKVAQLSLSFDHRLIDGDCGSRFIATVGAILSNPARAMMWS